MKKMLAVILLFSLIFCCACNTNEKMPEESKSNQTVSAQDEFDADDMSHGNHKIDVVIPANQFAFFLENEAEEKDLPYLVTPEAINLFDGEFQKVDARHYYRPTHPEPYYRDYVSYWYSFSLGDKIIWIEYCNNSYLDFDDINFVNHTGNDLSFFPEEMDSSGVHVKIGDAEYYYTPRLDNSLRSIRFKVGERWVIQIDTESGFPNNTSVAQRLLNKETAPAQIDELIVLFEGLLKES